jgi:hypothetical protein
MRRCTWRRELLRGEGFKDVHYVKVAGTGGRNQALADGRVDFAMGFVTPMILLIDAGAPVVMLAGVHPGCLELIAARDIKTIRELKGKTVSIPQYNGSHHLFLVAMISHVGVDPRRDINWIEQADEQALRSLEAGRGRRRDRYAPDDHRSAREKGRACDREYDHRPAVVAILLLRTHGAPRIRYEIPRCDQARAARFPQVSGRM